MTGTSARDKSVFQARRVVVSGTVDQPPEEKKFHPRELFPFKNSITKKHAFIASLFLVILLGAGAFGYYQYLLSQNPAVIYENKLKSITDNASHQVSLPTGEQPVIATVSDTRVLPKEVFFKNAQNGDKILLYKKHQEAILYRPSSGKVITYATLEFKDVTPTPSPEVAGVATNSAASVNSITPQATSSAVPFKPHGKILVQPQL